MKKMNYRYTQHEVQNNVFGEKLDWKFHTVGFHWHKIIKAETNLKWLKQIGLDREDRQEGRISKGHEELWGVIDMFLILIGVTVSQMYTYVKMDQIKQFISVTY